MMFQTTGREVCVKDGNLPFVHLNQLIYISVKEVKDERPKDIP